MTVYAQYTQIPVYTVTFHKNGGTAEADPNVMVVAQGSEIGSLPVPPTRSGYQFLNWSSLADGGSLIDENTVVWENMTAFAQWTTKKAFSLHCDRRIHQRRRHTVPKIAMKGCWPRERIVGPGGGFAMNWYDAAESAQNYYAGLNTPWITGSDL
jgi:hypothetical protein